MSDLVEYETIILDRLKFGLSQRVGGFTRASMKSGMHEVDAMNRYMLQTLELHLLAHKVDEQQVKRHVSTPSSWWQHLKQDHAPAWFLRRRPVKTERQEVSVTVQKWADFPGANFYPPALGSPTYKVRVK